MTEQHDKKGNKPSREEFRLSKYSCALKEKRGFLRHGTLLITTKSIQFTSNIFGIRKKITIPITSRLVIAKKTLLFVPNSLLFSNKQNPEGWFFTSFLSRDKCYLQTTKMVEMIKRDREKKKKKRTKRQKKIKSQDQEKNKTKTKHQRSRRRRKRRVSQPISKIDKEEIAKIKNEFLRDRSNNNSQNEQNSNQTEVLMENEKSTNKRLFHSLSENELLSKKKIIRSFSTTYTFESNASNSQGSEKILKKGVLTIYNKFTNEWLKREIVIVRNNENIVFQLSKTQPKKKIIGHIPINLFKKCKLVSELNFNIKLISGKVIRLKAKDKLEASNWRHFLNSFLISKDQKEVLGNEKNGNKNPTKHSENKNEQKKKSIPSKMIELFLKVLCILKLKMVLFALFFLTSLKTIGKFSFVSAQSSSVQYINMSNNNKINGNNLGSNHLNNNLLSIDNNFIDLNN
ncbi:hypothetical protein M0812_23570 [Anaeramoeba flamelloides]|uniref:PH domain-containing protein n=1 Tax=Anaeramoeba flamelloides TaxID=1746091 RepID=A0AAV7YM35_9EUKA|nr:hypothetical protein M0812_23570 [Anaeramoeba flamelloides]